MDLIFLLLFFFFCTEFTSDVSQDSGSKLLCSHGNVQYGNRRSMFLNHSVVFLKEQTVE